MASEIKALFAGKWKLYNRENYDAYLDVSGLDVLEKKLAKNVKPKVKIFVDDDGETIVYTFKTGVLNDTIRFKLGEPYEREYLGHKVKGTVTWSEGKMHIHLINDKKEHFIVREIINGEIVQTSTCDGVVAKMFYKRRQEKENKK